MSMTAAGVTALIMYYITAEGTLKTHGTSLS